MVGLFTLRASTLASSNPSVMIRGCSPSSMYLLACFNSSPTRSTTLVVPSPAMSSRAVAENESQQILFTPPLIWYSRSFKTIGTVPALAIITAVLHQEVSESVLFNLSGNEKVFTHLWGSG